MNILVTGAAGFIGSHVAERLQKEGFRVTGLDNFSPHYDPAMKRLNEKELLDQGIPIIQADLKNSEEIDQLDSGYDLIIHLAAQPGISGTSTFEDYFQNNVAGTQNLLSFAERNKGLRHLINISTSSVYGLRATHPETVAAEPASCYGVSKLAAEQLVLAKSRERLLNASSLRLFSVYGPRERPEKLYARLISCAFSQKKFPIFQVSLEHLRSFTYVGDVVDGIIRAVERHESLNGEIINIGSQQEYSTAEGIKIVEEILGVRIPLQEFPRRPGDQEMTAAVISKAEDILGYRPTVSLEQGLRFQVNWYRERLLMQTGL